MKMRKIFHIHIKNGKREEKPNGKYNNNKNKNNI
jgi:hypothetical protein